MHRVLAMRPQCVVYKKSIQKEPTRRISKLFGFDAINVNNGEKRRGSMVKPSLFSAVLCMGGCSLKEALGKEAATPAQMLSAPLIGPF